MIYIESYQEWCVKYYVQANPLNYSETNSNVGALSSLYDVDE